MDNENVVVFGIDVSSRKSNVCEMIGQDNVIKRYEISNDRVGFNILLSNLKVFAQKPEIIFEATGVYSERLQSFLDTYHFNYCRLNPLKAKQQLMRFRLNKTDKHDAYGLANSQYIFHRHPEYQITLIYKKLKSLGHYYDQLTHDLIISKNRLHRVLQEVFPDIEQLFSTPKGENYWQCIIKFTHPALVKTAGLDNTTKQLRTLNGIGHHRAKYLAQRLLSLANNTYPSVPMNFPQVGQARDYAQRLIILTSKRKAVVTQMVTMTHQLKHDDLSILNSIPGI
ncbi:IS110 family transposase [Limosilactobacillus frumenti]|nr:IS110 family transposase [Limosilactobacillus frumenti]